MCVCVLEVSVVGLFHCMHVHSVDRRVQCECLICLHVGEGEGDRPHVTSQPPPPLKLVMSCPLCCVPTLSSMCPTPPSHPCAPPPPLGPTHWSVCPTLSFMCPTLPSMCPTPLFYMPHPLICRCPYCYHRMTSEFDSGTDRRTDRRTDGRTVHA